MINSTKIILNNTLNLKSEEKITLIFGGSFNPIHEGHLFLIKSLARENWVGRIIIMPCGKHAFAKQLAAGADRLQMCNLAIASIEEADLRGKIMVSDWEIQAAAAGKINYTYQTLQAWQLAYPQQKIAFIFGADALRDFEKWRDYDLLATDFEMLVVRRNDILIDFEKMKKWPMMRAWDLPESPEYGAVSSTLIRKKIANNESITALLPQSVEDYIVQADLYRE